MEPSPRAGQVVIENAASLDKRDDGPGSQHRKNGNQLSEESRSCGKPALLAYKMELEKHRPYGKREEKKQDGEKQHRPAAPEPIVPDEDPAQAPIFLFVLCDDWRFGGEC